MANAVLRRSDSRLVAVLPFAAAEYRNDFKEPADLAEFEHLLAQASEVVALTNVHDEADPKEAETTAASPAEARNRGYLAAGQRVVDNCEILIAIWDGEPRAGIGGTAQAIQYAPGAEEDRLLDSCEESPHPGDKAAGTHAGRELLRRGPPPAGHD